MAIPTAPTLDSIVIEALRKANSMENYQRAKIEWIEEIKRDIAGRKDWKSLEATTVLIPTAYKQSVVLPTDFGKPVKVLFHSGERTGTSPTSANGVGFILLAAAETISEADAKGKLVFVYSGTGSKQVSRIVDYSATTKLATVSPSWTTAPNDGTSKYMISDFERELSYTPWEDIDLNVKTGKPELFAIYEGSIYANAVPDVSTYAMVVDYLVDISLIDATGTKATELHREWRNALLFGIEFRAYVEKGDARQGFAFQQYETAIARIAGEDARSRRTRRSAALKSIGGLPLRRG